MTDRTLDVMIDGVPVAVSCRKSLTGEDNLSLFPALFELRLWNLPEADYLALGRAQEISVSHDGACLASGKISDVFRQGTAEGVVTTVAFSLGLDLWEAFVSLTVPAGTALSDTVRRILSASGAGIPLLSFPSEDFVSSRPQSFYGRAAECVTTALSFVSPSPHAQSSLLALGARSPLVSHDSLRSLLPLANAPLGHRSLRSPRAVLSPSGLMVIPPGGLPVSMVLTEKDLTDAPSFAGGAIHGVPPVMILSVSAAGWRPGETVRVEYKDIAAAGIITDRGVDTDTAGVWKSGMVIEII